jgi:hypothetical protein
MSRAQCLARTPVVRQFALAAQPDPSRPFTGALQKLMVSMWDTSSNEVASEELRGYLVAKYPGLLGGDWHQDAQELLCCLFDSLEAEEDQRLQNEKPNFARANFYSTVSSTVTCQGCSLVPYRTHAHTKRHARHARHTGN